MSQLPALKTKRIIKFIEKLGFKLVRQKGSHCFYRHLDEYDDSYVQETFSESDIIGVSLLGAPYMPDAIELAQKLQNDFPGKTIAFGGQVIEHISREAFNLLFQSPENVKQIISDVDFAEWLGEDVSRIPHPLKVSYQPVWEQMRHERLRRYLQHEMTLDTSRGCIYRCKFCAARKRQKEQFRDLQTFENDLKFLAERARNFGINKVEFYASSLDFFQNPESMGRRLATITEIQEDIGVQIKVRCLTSMSTFLRAREVINKLISAKEKPFREFSDFYDLLSRSGLWCIGFGVDGADETVWQRWTSNLAYLAIIALFYPLAKCDTSPLLPQGERGLYGLIAKIFNRLAPSDK